jgi:hypothetical protein
VPSAKTLFDAFMHGPVLALLTALFSLRVMGQALVVYVPVSWLPAAEHWASGLIPYRILLIIQIAMLVLMVKIAADIWRGTGLFSEQRASWTPVLIGFSALYAGVMMLRYLLTMLFLPEMRWFGGTIPIFFHFVLAAFIYVWGNFQTRRAIFARP